MANSAPRRITLVPDEYDAKYVGRTADGRQFFLTTPFVPLGHDFVALYLFDKHGELLEARIDDSGSREHLDHQKLDHQKIDSLIASHLSQLGEYSLCPIKVAPFCVQRFDTEFGLIAHPPEEAGEEWTVTAEPGDYMAFSPPWDGDYDT